MNKIRMRVAAIALVLTLTGGAVLGATESVSAAYWRGTWYGPIYVFSPSETNSIANSPFNIPIGSVNPFSWIVPTYRFWWSQTAQTARMMHKCLGIHFTGSPQIVNC